MSMLCCLCRGCFKILMPVFIRILFVYIIWEAQHVFIYLYINMENRDIMVDDAKKRRGANFTSADKQLLLKLANKYRSVVENKKTDGTTWKEKDNTWKRIEHEFNSNGNGQPRSSKQLKFKYEAIKKEMKKKYSTHKVYIKGTGGGKHVNPPGPETEEEKLLLSTIAVTVDGLQSQYDSDALAGIQGISLKQVHAQCEVTDGIEENVENDNSQEGSQEKSIDVDWGHPSAAYLQTPVHPVLKRKITLSKTSDFEEAIAEMPCVLETIETQNEHDYVKETDKEDMAHGSRTPKPLKNDWTSRRRPRLPKKKCMSSAAVKFESLAERKIKFVEEAIEQQRRRHVCEELQHDLKIKNLKLENNILILQEQLLKKQLT